MEMEMETETVIDMDTDMDMEFRTFAKYLIWRNSPCSALWHSTAISLVAPLHDKKNVMQIFKNSYFRWDSLQKMCYLNWKYQYGVKKGRYHKYLQ
jgi:hypothetical protein